MPQGALHNLVVHTRASHYHTCLAQRPPAKEPKSSAAMIARASPHWRCNTTTTEMPVLGAATHTPTAPPTQLHITYTHLAQCKRWHLSVRQQQAPCLGAQGLCRRGGDREKAHKALGSMMGMPAPQSHKSTQVTISIYTSSPLAGAGAMCMAHAHTHTHPPPKHTLRTAGCRMQPVQFCVTPQPSQPVTPSTRSHPQHRNRPRTPQNPDVPQPPRCPLAQLSVCRSSCTCSSSWLTQPISDDETTKQQVTETRQISLTTPLCSAKAVSQRTVRPALQQGPGPAFVILGQARRTVNMHACIVASSNSTAHLTNHICQTSTPTLSCMADNMTRITTSTAWLMIVPKVPGTHSCRYTGLGRLRLQSTHASQQPPLIVHGDRPLHNCQQGVALSGTGVESLTVQHPVLHMLPWKA